VVSLIVGKKNNFSLKEDRQSSRLSNFSNSSDMYGMNEGLRGFSVYTRKPLRGNITNVI